MAIAAKKKPGSKQGRAPWRCPILEKARPIGGISVATPSGVTVTEFVRKTKKGIIQPSEEEA